MTSPGAAPKPSFPRAMLLERILVVAHAILVGSLVYRAVRRGPALFDAQLGRRDAILVRRLAHWAVVPGLVLGREALRALLLVGLGGTPGGLEYLVFHAWVPGADALADPVAAVVIHLVPNLALLAVAGGIVARTIHRPGTAAWNHLWLEVARLTAWITLLVYPVVSLLVREYDFFAARARLETLLPHAGDAFLVLWGGLAVLFIRFDRGAFRERWRLLATPVRDAIDRAESRLERHPEDAEALRELGRAYLAGNAPDQAMPLLDRAVAADPDAPESRFLRGAAHLRLGAAQKASAELRAAGQLLEAASPPRPELVHEVTLGLAAARLALGDAEGALLTAEEASAQRPRDPRGLLLTVDALLADGQLDEAERRLERAASRAQGLPAKVLAARLEGLRKTLGRSRRRRGKRKDAPKDDPR